MRQNGALWEGNLSRGMYLQMKRRLRGGTSADGMESFGSQSTPVIQPARENSVYRTPVRPNHVCRRPVPHVGGGSDRSVRPELRRSTGRKLQNPFIHAISAGGHGEDYRQMCADCAGTTR
ncbi:hypothetical protein Bbelb_225300 [Branchiostoma belcheri]|nr:hypothetical protein Bbelb_225300 [Branchiostoma belcheri]